MHHSSLATIAWWEQTCGLVIETMLRVPGECIRLVILVLGCAVGQVVRLLAWVLGQWGFQVAPIACVLVAFALNLGGLRTQYLALPAEMHQAIEVLAPALTSRAPSPVMSAPLPAPPGVAAPTPTAATCGTARVLAQELNIRVTPGGDVLGQLYGNEEVVLWCDRYRLDGTDWVHIRAGRYGGWVSRRYLSAPTIR